MRRPGIVVGLLVSVVSGFTYLYVLHAPGDRFYPFAALAFVLGPVVAGTIDSIRDPSHRSRAFIGSGGRVFGTVFVLFLLIYAVLIRLYTIKVQLPSDCDGTYRPANIPAALRYPLPDGAEGVLIDSNQRTAVVATLDYERPPHRSTVFIIHKESRQVVWQMDFPDDNIAASMDGGTVYVFNKGLGYFVNELTGAGENYFLTMDTYGTNDRGYFETTGIISSWDRNGSVKSLPRLAFSGITRGCYVSAEGRLTRLR
jgi:hypothetical protein